MNVFALSDIQLLKRSFNCKCPKCNEGDLFKPGLSLDLRDACQACGFDLSKNDSADGPAVFLIFILGTLLVPIAWVFELWLAPPLWVHAVLWGAVSIALTVLSLKPLKSYIIALQYKHRPTDWD